MNTTYRETIMKMEDAGTDPEYVLGWQGGYLGHPKREEQRVTEAYEAGFKDGQDKALDQYKNWKQPQE